MSERRATEIKFRVTPSEKALWQAEADDEGVGLSGLIRRRMNVMSRAKEALWAAQNAKLDGASLLRDNAIELLDPCHGACNGHGCEKQPPLPAERDVCTTDPCSCDTAEVEAPSWLEDKMYPTNNGEIEVPEPENVKPDWTFEGRSV
jgi:hypothetical protein